MQDWTTSDMIFDVPTLISFLSQDTTLYPGTVILTGNSPGRWICPEAAGLPKPGDQVAVEIEKIGVLENAV